MPSTDAQQEAFNRSLLQMARGSIAYGLKTGKPGLPKIEPMVPAFEAERATFVTLKKQGQLRGCIGSLQAHRPLYQDIAANAFAAAFRDPRFPPLQADEFKAIHIELSLLTAPEPLPVASEADLLAKLVPGRDGLILQDGGKRATFLPAVWETLPDPRDFLTHLKAKAGMAPDHWSDSMQVQIYRAEKISEE